MSQPAAAADTKTSTGNTNMTRRPANRSGFITKNLLRPYTAGDEFRFCQVLLRRFGSYIARQPALQESEHRGLGVGQIAPLARVATGTDRNDSYHRPIHIGLENRRMYVALAS